MGRDVSVQLQALLDKLSCNTQTTLSIYPAVGDPIHLSTDAVSAKGTAYTADLRATDALRQSIDSVTDRVIASIQNVDKAFGPKIIDEDLINAEAVIGRIFRDEQDLTSPEWEELFRGAIIPLELTELEARVEAVSDLVAAGFCVGHWPLSENCVFVFKHAGTCGYVGAETDCNKKRRSKFGCIGRDNEHHFGGMEFPEPQAPSSPSGGDPPGGGFPQCPRLDQYVPARGDSEFDIVARRVADIKQGQWLWDPIAGDWDRVVEAEVIPVQPIWELIAHNGATCYSSPTHPAIADQGDTRGTPVSSVERRDPVLTWSNGKLAGSTVWESRLTRERADVMRIELAKRRIYAVGAQPGQYIVSHNYKDPSEILV